MDDKNAVFRQLKDLGIKENTALSILKCHEEDNVKNLLEVIKNKKFHNPGAFLIKALDDKWFYSL